MAAPEHTGLKKVIKIKLCNGLSFAGDVEAILRPVLDRYDFVDSEHPDFIIFGPYGNQFPPPGKYVRIGYFCENFRPDTSICEWSFGVPREEEVGHPHYQRIQWHGIRPEQLVKTLDENTIDRLCSRGKFCNFLYSHEVPYREQFFRQLSKYRRIDAPGKSMNNCTPLGPSSNRWQQKRDFLKSYRFTIAFENYRYPGYQTEKLYDAMLANSLPVYCGDPFIGEVFDECSFFQLKPSADLLAGGALGVLARHSQANLRDMLPAYYTSPIYRVRRKVKAWGRALCMKMQVKPADMERLIEEIIAADRDPHQYARYLRRPWLKENVVAPKTSSREQWIRIFG